MREYMRRKHGFKPRVGKGVVKGNLVPYEKDFSPSAWPAGVTRLKTRQLVDYMAYINKRGYTIQELEHPRGGRVYRMVPFSQAGGIIRESKATYNV